METTIKQFEAIGSLLVLASMALLATGELFAGFVVASLSCVVWFIFAIKADHGYLMLLQIALFMVNVSGVISHG